MALTGSKLVGNLLNLDSDTVTSPNWSRYGLMILVLSIVMLRFCYKHIDIYAYD